MVPTYAFTKGTGPRDHILHKELPKSGDAPGISILTWQGFAFNKFGVGTSLFLVNLLLESDLFLSKPCYQSGELHLILIATQV